MRRRHKASSREEIREASALTRCKVIKKGE